MARLALDNAARSVQNRNDSDYYCEDRAINERGGYKRSRQRERILELVRSHEGHPTADWIYGRLKGEFPNLSLGTVYRNLNVLLEQGLIGKIDFGSTYDRFDGNTGPHYHFVCERCGAIIDLEVPIDRSLDRRVNEATPYTVRRHRIEFYGVCDRCGAGGAGGKTDGTADGPG